MKYTILINQYAAVKSGLDLDLIDLCIFDFIKDFANSNACTKFQTPEGIYFWISHKLIIQEMPLLNIKTAPGLIKRIDNLIQSGLIVKHPNCEMYSRTLYAFGENYDLLTFCKSTEFEKEFTPPNESLGVPKQKFIAPPNESLGDYIIRDNTIIKEEREPGEKAPDSLFPENEIETVDKAKKTLFANSIYKEFETFILKFNKPEYETVDLFYYFTSVKNWSDKKDMKRTARGWIATAQDFMRGDKEKNKLKLKPEFNTTGGENTKAMMEYLTGY